MHGSHHLVGLLNIVLLVIIMIASSSSARMTHLPPFGAANVLQL